MATGEALNSAYVFRKRLRSAAILEPQQPLFDTFWFGSSGSSISGSLAATLGDVTLAASGALRISGALTSTLGAVTLSASGSGVVGIQGGLSATLGAVSLLSIGRLSGVVAGPVAGATKSASPVSGVVTISAGTLSASTKSASPVPASLAIAAGPVADALDIAA